MTAIAVSGDRDRELAALESERFDLAIVGGGVTGAALACLATAGPRPLRVALLEASALARRGLVEAFEEARPAPEARVGAAPAEARP